MTSYHHLHEPPNSRSSPLRAEAAVNALTFAAGPSNSDINLNARTTDTIQPANEQTGDSDSDPLLSLADSQRVFARELYISYWVTACFVLISIAAVVIVAVAWPYLQHSPSNTSLVDRVPDPSRPRSDPCSDCDTVVNRTYASVALCMAVKDATIDLIEWVAWHHHIAGIERMYIFDNLDSSHDEWSGRNSLRHYIEAGVVVYHPYLWDSSPSFVRERFDHQQKFVYNLCITLYRIRHSWLALIDADEFIEFTDIDLGRSLGDVVKEYEADDVGSLFLSWRFFANHNQTVLVRQTVGTVMTYTSCFPIEDDTDYHDHRHGKTITRPRFAVESGPHHVTLQQGYHPVDELHRQVAESPALPYHTSKRIWVNHYVSRSVEENRQKTERGASDKSLKTRDWFDYADRGATSQCTSAKERLMRAGLSFV